MITETERIQKLLIRSWQGPMWHGATLKFVFEGIAWQKAFAKPLPDAHNIYELVVHMYSWRKFVLENLKGNVAYTLAINSETDWPTHYEETEATWNNAMAELEQNQKELIAAFSNFNDRQLDEPVPGKKFSWYTLIHGMIHHDIYHSAQISLLKKG